MKIILTGYMGSGKTAVGVPLSEKLQLPFIDLDEEISNLEKRSISRIFETSGEIYFRKKETEVLKILLEQEKSSVISLGGGTPCYGKNLELIKDTPNTVLIYLKTGIEPLKQRLWREKEQRPLVAQLNSLELLEDFIRKHLFERSFYYNQSDYIISTDQKVISEIVNEIFERLN